MSSYRVRPAQPRDAPAIFDLIVELAKYEKLESEVTGSPEALEADLGGDAPACEAFVAELPGGAAIAYALYFSTYSTFGTRPGLYLEDLFVLPEHRGHGIGTALLRAVAKTAVERQRGRLEWAVLDWNQSAIDFYLALGSQPMSGWTTHRVSGEALLRLANPATGRERD